MDEAVFLQILNNLLEKARKKKNSSFQTTITKSVFLYGRPNKEKLAVLRQMLQNAIRIVYEKRHIAYEEKKAASA